MLSYGDAIALRFGALSSQLAWKAAISELAQDHFGMIAKRNFHDLGVILRADGQNDAAVLELLGVVLQSKMRFAGRASLSEHDAVRACRRRSPRPTVYYRDRAPGISSTSPAGAAMMRAAKTGIWCAACGAISSLP